MSEPAPIILVVDDEEMIRVNLSAYFEDEGFTVLTAESGEEALAILREQTVDVGVFDMRLPGMDGNATIREAHKIQPSIKKMVYTGSTNYSPPADIADLGVAPEQVFQKPVLDMGLLVDCIQNLLAKEKT